MKKLVAFDLDDTLAETKQPIDAEIAKLLKKLLQNRRVLVITGGKWEQIQHNVLKQLDLSVRDKSHLHCMSVNGAKYHHYNKDDDTWQTTTYIDNLSAEQVSRIHNVLESAARELGYWEANPQGEIIQNRGTQVTFSALGQNASPAAKRSWDPDYSKRRQMRTLVAAQLPEYSIAVNGNTSIDVLCAGYDKGFGVQQLLDTLKLTIDDAIFIGDQLQENGNDYPVKQLGVDTIEVHSPGYTKAAIHAILQER